MPELPADSPWDFPDLGAPQIESRFEGDLVGAGADLEPGTLIAAYAAGLFPMPGPLRGDPVHWWSPKERGVLPLDGLTVSRSLRASCRRMEVRVDTAFAEVLEACAVPRGNGDWINGGIVKAYQRLHDLGWAHSVEAWLDGVLVGGLYGVALGGLFAGESMFHRVTDASKVALVGLVGLLDDGYQRLLDTQWRTDHLASLGVIEMDRLDYVRRLREVLTEPAPAAFG